MFFCSAPRLFLMLPLSSFSTFGAVGHWTSNVSLDPLFLIYVLYVTVYVTVAICRQPSVVLVNRSLLQRASRQAAPPSSSTCRVCELQGVKAKLIQNQIALERLQKRLMGGKNGGIATCDAQTQTVDDDRTATEAALETHQKQLLRGKDNGGVATCDAQTQTVDDDDQRERVAQLEQQLEDREREAREQMQRITEEWQAQVEALEIKLADAETKAVLMADRAAAADSNPTKEESSFDEQVEAISQAIQARLKTHIGQEQALLQKQVRELKVQYHETLVAKEKLDQELRRMDSTSSRQQQYTNKISRLEQQLRERTLQFQEQEEMNKRLQKHLELLKEQVQEYQSAAAKQDERFIKFAKRIQALEERNQLLQVKDLPEEESSVHP